MALKDWKKISHISNEIVWDLPNKKRPNSQIPMIRVHVVDSPLAGWDVVIQSKNDESIDNFERKKGAIDFAKQYMRSH